jgi:hypothetical protein
VDVDDVWMAKPLQPLELLRPIVSNRLVGLVGGPKHFEGVTLVKRPNAFVHGPVLPIADECSDDVRAPRRGQRRPRDRKRNHIRAGVG